MGKAPKKTTEKKGKADPIDKRGKDPEKKGKGGAQQINVRHILCEKHARKEEALARIRDGDKFDEVARTFSEDKARQGGALGWKLKGSLAKEFEEVAYGLQPSSTSSPLIGEAKTEFGYHIIMVEGRK